MKTVFDTPEASTKKKKRQVEKPAKNEGKEIEKATGKAFKDLMGKGKAVVVRLHDTKSSAFFLPPSAGDFMGVAFGKPLLVECKSSEVGHSFSDCSLKDFLAPTQFAYHRLWLNQGGVSLFIFHSLLMNKVELWRGEDVLNAYASGQPLKGVIATFAKKPTELVLGIERFMEGL